MGIGGVSHKIKKGYIGDETGKARLFYSSGRIWKKYTVQTQYNWNRYNIGTVQNIVAGSSRYTVPGSRGYYSNWNLFAGTSYTFSNGLYYLSFYRTIQGPGSYRPGSQWASSKYGLGDAYAYALPASQGINAGSTWMVETSDREDSYFAIGEAHDGVRWDIEAGFYYLPGDHFYTVTQGQGSYNGAVSSLSQSAYPQNGQSGGYWYVYQNSSRVQGAYVADVEADPGTYPSNSEHSDGYWYVLQPE